MSANEDGYVIQSQVHGNRLTDSGTVVSGYTINVRDNVSGTTFPVFLPDDRYNADNARTLIVSQLQHIRAVHSLSE